MTTIVRTYSGAAVDLLKPDAAAIDMGDIAHHLSIINRFAGASEFPIPVAQHSLHVERILGQRGATAARRLLGLLHDGHQYILGEIITPAAQAIKIMAPVSEFDRIDFIKGLVNTALFGKLAICGITAADWEMVRLADAIAFATEWRFAMKGPCPIAVQPASFEVREMHWTIAKQKFLEKFDALAILCGLPARQSRGAPA
jgi:hypothetical protein